MKRQNIFYYVCMKERESADVWIENKYFGRIWVKLSWKLQYPWTKTEKEKNISHCNRSRVVISIEERERANYQKQCEREWRAKRSKSLYHQINNTEDVNVIKLISSGREQCWKKKKEDLLAIKLNCLGHIWQDKCELEAANIAQIYFSLLEISQPQMWRRNGISNRLSIMTGSGLTTTRTKMHCC